MSYKSNTYRDTSDFNYEDVVETLVEGLPHELYCYVNYKKLQRKSEKSGITMERSEESYGRVVLKSMKEICGTIPKDKFKNLKYEFDPETDPEELYSEGHVFNPIAERLVEALYCYIFYDKSMKRTQASYGTAILKALKKLFRNVPENEIIFASNIYYLRFAG